MYTTEHCKQAKEKFLEKYRKEIVPALLMYEKQEKFRNKISLISILISLFLAVLCFVVCIVIVNYFPAHPLTLFLNNSSIEKSIIIVPAFLIFWFGSFISCAYTNSINKKEKKKALHTAFSCFGDFKKINADEYKNLKIFKDSNFVSPYNWCHIRNIFSAALKIKHMKLSMLFSKKGIIEKSILIAKYFLTD